MAVAVHAHAAPAAQIGGNPRQGTQQRLLQLEQRERALRRFWRRFVDVVPIASRIVHAVQQGLQIERRVRVARPLVDTDETRLKAALTRRYGRPVHLNVVVDPAVIGGIRVEIGDDVIDGTVSSRLDDARRKIAG